MIRPFEELVFRQHHAAGIRDTYENRRYDAFFLMIAFYANLAATPGSAAEPAAAPAEEPAPAPEPERGPEGEAEAAAGTPTEAEGERGAGPPQDAPPAGSPPTWSPPWDPDTSVPLPAKLPGGDNVKVIVNVDHTALLRGHTEAGETCEIAGIGPISVRAVRNILANDPFLAVVVRKGRDVVNVAHHGRGLNAHQRTAIEADGIRCTNIACNRTIAIQIDHRHPYAADPITALDNVDPLCPPDHKLKTHHGHHLEAGTGRRRLLPPEHPDNPSTPNPDTGPGQHHPPDWIPTKEEADRIEARLRNQFAQRKTRREQPAPC